MRALVTGFDPFDGDSVNPASEAVGRLAGTVAGVEVATRSLPTVFGRSLARLEEAIAEIRPDIVLCVGQAGGRAALSLERVALNLDDARIADNDGHQPIDRAVVPGGPPAYFATLPIKAIVAALRTADLPAVVSNTAGTFVCNHVFYGLMHLAAERGGDRPFRGGFLHVPYLPSQAARLPGTPSMALDDIVRAIGIVLSVAADRRADLRTAEGALS